METKRATSLTVKVEAKPGTLSKIAAQLRDAGVNCLGLWAFNMGPDAAEAIIIPENAAKAKSVLQGARSSTAFLLFGEDKVGVLCPTLDAIAKAGINLEAVGALGVGGRCATCIWPRDEDVDKVAKILGA